MVPTTRLAACGLALALATVEWSAPVGAADCGDAAGAGGARVACECGDSVVTDTRLEASDGVVTHQCGAVGLVIARDAIALDCDGLELQGGAGPPLGAGVVIVSDDVAVRRCDISGFEHGIRASPGVRESRILSNRLTDNVVAGILLGSSSQHNDVIGNLASDNGQVGIQVNSAAEDNRVIGNRVSGHAVAGIQFNSRSDDNRVLLNQITGQGGRGIQFNSSAKGNKVAFNSVTGGDLGINFNSDARLNRVSRNVITGTALAGIRFSGGGHRNRINLNVVSNNGGEGVRVEAEARRNLLAANLVLDNDDDGIEVCGVPNVVARNEARFNGDWDICAVTGNLDIRNAAGEVTFDCPVPPDCEPLPIE